MLYFLWFATFLSFSLEEHIKINAISRKKKFKTRNFTIFFGPTYIYDFKILKNSLELTNISFHQKKVLFNRLDS